MPKRPAFQFYPGDWLRSTDLRSCSVGARGLWIDMICLMHEGNPYGHLKVGDKVILPVNLASMVGADLAQVTEWLAELEKSGVFSLKNGCIVCRRMIRDEKIRESRAKGGILGGNPALISQGKVNLQANLQPTPASAVAVASAVNATTNTGRAVRKANGFDLPNWITENEHLLSAWNCYLEMRVKIRKPATDRAKLMAVNTLANLRDSGQLPVAVLNQSVLKCWTDLYPLKDPNGPMPSMPKR